MASSRKLRRLFEPGLSVRTHILLIVLGGAVLPLVLMALWLTSRGANAGEELLVDHLEASAKRFAEAADSRWQFREGDLLLLSENTTAARLVSGGALSGRDSAYLSSLFAATESSVETLAYEDSAGNVRWERHRVAQSGNVPSAGSSTSSPAVTIRRVVRDANGRERGHLVVAMSVSAILPSDTLRPLVPGSALAIRNAETHEVLISLSRDLAFPSHAEFEVDGSRWLSRTERTVGPPLEIAVAAPTAGYVGPFQRAIRRGIAAVAFVTAIIVLLTVYLAVRLTAPLERLSIAADAIASGEFDRHVDAGGPSEVRRLVNAFNGMAKSLRGTLDELSQRSSMAAVGEFATSLSHDVRNALTSVRVDLQRAVKKPVSDPVHSQLVSRALDNVTRLDSTVSGALRVARGAHQQNARVDLREILLACVTTVSPAFAGVPATIDLRDPRFVPLVNGDRSALEQLFTNLLFNAAQASEPGGSTMIEIESDDSDYVVSVIDTGVGMDADQLSKASRPFYSSKPFGTGVGLAIVRQIAAAHDGSVEMASEVGVGTTVRVRLPGISIPTAETVRG